MILLFASFCIRKKSHLIAKKNVVLFILTHKFSRHALRLSETHGSDLKIVMPCCFLKNLFGGAFHVIPGCGFLEVLEIKNLVERPLERQGESLGMTFAGHHFEPVDYDFVHQDDTLL